MTTQSSPLKGSGAAILDYLYDEILGYYETAPGEAPRRPRDLGPDDIVFGLDQLHGSAAEALGIDFAATGGMTKAQFYALAAGRHPVTGDQLVERRSRPVYVLGADGQPATDERGNKITATNPRTGEEVRETTSHVGIDVYFAAPKSVSIARVVAEEENPALGKAISEAHARAVAETLTQIEQSALLGRRSIATPTEAGERVVTKGPRKGQSCKTQGSVTERVPVQLLIASVAQHCARPTEETLGREAPPDMHLHQHNLILNIGVDLSTGKIGAIDDYGLKSAGAKHDAWYLGHLSRELQDIGIELEFGDFETSRHGRVPWRVKGIGLEAEEHYSSGRRRAWNLAKDYEANHPGKAATQTIIKERMRGTRLPKDELAKAQDSAPVWSLWTQDAAKVNVELASEELRTRMREGHRLEPVKEAARHDELWKRLHSAKGLTKDDATFSGADISEALARCSEGLGYTTDELGALELELYDSLVVVRAAHEPRHVRYTTQTQLDVERRIEDGVASKVASSYPSVSPEILDRAFGDAAAPLDEEQRAVVTAVCAGRGAVFVEGLAGTGKTTAMATAVMAMREAGTVDQIIVVSTAARTAQSVGKRLNADFAGSVESLAARVDRGSLLMTPSTMVIYDESAMCDTSRQDRFLTALGPSRVIYVGDPHQAQAIGAGGWYQDATEAHGALLLTAVHRQKNPEDIATNAALRAGRGHEAVASLAARGRMHVSSDAQGALSAVVNAYTLHRDAGRKADEVVVLLDSSNANVDVANRQIQHFRRVRREVTGEGFEVEETSTGRHWNLHAGDRVLTLAPLESSAGRIPNGTNATVIDVRDDGTLTVELNAARATRPITIHLDRSAETQPLGLAYAVHSAKYQGGEALVVLVLPGARGQTSKFSAYSSLTRATEEVHVFPDDETHGPDPLDHLGRAWEEAPAKASAQRVAKESVRHYAPPAGPAATAAAAGSPPPPPPPGGPPDGPNGPEGPEDPDDHSRGRHSDEEEAFLDREMDRLTRVVGPERVAEIKASPGYEDLRTEMLEMRKEGHNVTAALKSSARAGGLDDRDLGGDLTKRMQMVRADAAPGRRLEEPRHIRPLAPEPKGPKPPPPPPPGAHAKEAPTQGPKVTPTSEAETKSRSQKTPSKPSLADQLMPEVPRRQHTPTRRAPDPSGPRQSSTRIPTNPTSSQTRTPSAKSPTNTGRVPTKSVPTTNSKSQQDGTSPKRTRADGTSYPEARRNPNRIPTKDAQAQEPTLNRGLKR